MKTREISKETWIAIASLLGIAIYLIARFALHARFAEWALIAVLLGGVPLLFDLLKKLAAFEVGSDALAGISIITSAILGEYLAGAIIVLMLSGGTALELYATRRASSVLSALAKRVPNSAHRLTDAGIIDVVMADVRIDDRLVVLPHEICPVDGAVVEGRGTMDESYLTGEPFQIAKAPGSEVLSGAINGEAAMTIVVTKLPVDSRYAKIVQVMEQAEAQRPRLRRIADRLGGWYTLLALAIAVAGWIIGGEPRRFLAVLVIATPCPLLLAIPVAIIGAISLAATRGIIIKNPAMLEQIDRCRTIIFDKTGTLTYGKPSLTDVLCASGVTREIALRLAVSLEQYSRHPLAISILDAARAEGVAAADVADISERPGEGLRGHVGGDIVEITGRKNVAPRIASQLPPPAAGMECVILRNGEYAATLRFQDVPRAESRSFVHHLLPHHQVGSVMLLSGDRDAEVQHLAGLVGIENVRSGASPEEKLAIVRAEAAKGSTLFLGDGINDAPAMEAATVGVAFGHNSDITAEAADAVVLDQSLASVDELIHIGRRMRRIALQSAVGGMTLSMIGMLAAAAGWLAPVPGAVAQEVIDVLAVLNALRVAAARRELSDLNG
ncbi:MAG: cadmium-translocating P-type ATPase [Acidobacteria bacterium]|nr:cadmium-translocating P-type ATPase [Acidobacteriota bacterium]MBV9067163.1 cadmium-translocating P-type ATPase [Acidobacteriota bacterium]MBV9187077.1 cadmium-translocating P-type ATPase [Acidobacteriota bacterium]